MTKFSVVLVVVGLISFTSAAPEPGAYWMMENPALKMLQNMQNGRPAFIMPMMPEFPKIPVITPEQMEENLKKSGGQGVGSYMRSETTMVNGKAVKKTEGKTFYKDGDKMEVYEFGDKD